MAQWKLYDHLTFSALIQKIGYTVYSIHYTEITTVFVESKYVLPKEIPENSNFAGFNLVVAPNKEKIAYAIILYLYKSNIQICWERQLGPYHKVDLTMFWFISIVGCWRWLILACSIQASIFTMSYFLDCCDNHIYKGDQNRDIPIDNIDSITTRQFICYFDSED